LVATNVNTVDDAVDRLVERQVAAGRRCRCG
jgi:hypothetical protein